MTKPDLISVDNYVKANKSCCLIVDCEGEAISYGLISQTKEGDILLERKCKKCDYTWTDKYAFINYQKGLIMTKEQHFLNELYLDYFNNYQTVELFAEHKYLSIEGAKAMLKEGKLVNQNQGENYLNY